MKSAVALAVAALWSIGLIVIAMVAPFYQSSSASSSTAISAPGAAPTTLEPAPVVTSSSSTLVEVNGPGVLVPVGIPLLAVALVGLSLRRRHVKGARGAGPFAWTVVGLLGAFNVLAMLSIGILVLPVALLLVIACATVASSSATSPSTPAATTNPPARPKDPPEKRTSPNPN